MKPARPEDDGPTELFRLLDEVRRCLEGTDLPGANAALKRANAEVAALGSVPSGDHKTAKESEGQAEF